MLKAKLLDLERQEREAEMAAIKGEQQRVGFGSQIRSYVLQPYQMVKDAAHRARDRQRRRRPRRRPRPVHGGLAPLRSGRQAGS